MFAKKLLRDYISVYDYNKDEYVTIYKTLPPLDAEAMKQASK